MEDVGSGGDPEATGAPCDETGGYFITEDGQFRVPPWLWDQLEREFHPAMVRLLCHDLDALAAALAVTRDRLRERWLRAEWLLPNLEL